MKILITCLRRSGSTAFWKLFRQDKRILCFDEPFNPMLQNLPQKFLKGTNDEFIAIFKKNEKKFQKYFIPIHYKDEIINNKLKPITDYLTFLFNLQENVVIDATRINFNLDKVLPKLPKDVQIIYLYRSPKAFVSSHIIPNRPELLNCKSTKFLLSKLKAAYNKLFFFKIRSGFNDWGYETIAYYMGLRNIPAYEKLLHIWKLSYDQAQKAKLNFHDRVTILNFEKFCREPEYYVKDFYHFFNLEYKEISYSNINNPNPGYYLDNLKWTTSFRKYNINE